MAHQLIAGTERLLTADTPTLTMSTSIPSNSPTDQDTNEPLFELVLTQGKGFGLFAATNIPRGTRIIELAPLLGLPPDEPGKIKLSDLPKAVEGLTCTQRDAYFELYRAHNSQTATCVAAVLSQDQSLLKDPRLEEITHAIAIFTTNTVQMGENNEYGSGVVEHYSRINHSCSPNVHNSYNPTIGMFTIHAVRQINKGEEIVTSYINGSCRTHEQRTNLLRNWGFKCECECCSGPKAAAVEKRRSKMFELDQNLAFYGHGLPPVPGYAIPRTPQAALKVAEELLELLELLRSESITDFGLTVYCECSRFSLAMGQFDKAVSYAKKDRNVEHYCIGIETAHLKKDLKGAEHWLEHVLGERENDQTKRKADGKALKEKMALEMAPKPQKGAKGKKK